MSFTLWFMGRPAAGKSTIAKRVEQELADRDIPVENLDGDDLRANLDPELGFSKEDRHVHNRRTAYLCKVLNRNGVPAIVAMITPFQESQRQAREIVETEGRFVLIHVECSLEGAAKRDPKGHYEAARAGEIPKFTGVSHPFHPPEDPDIRVDTESASVDEAVTHVLDRLSTLGVIESVDENDTELSSARRKSAADTLSQKGYDE